MKYIVYGKDGCLYCVKAKDLLTNNGIDYDYVDVSVQANRDELLSLAESFGVTVRTVPQIFFEVGEDIILYVGGFDELANVLNNAK